MKLTIVGGGSTYTPELMDGIAREKEALPFSEIWLFDPNRERLRILAEFSKRLLAFHGSTAALVSTGDQASALAEADFVVSQIRVGGQAARQKDTELGLKNGLIGQETTGCGGFTCALRHIPASVEMAHEMERLCPKAILINFTNPAGMVTEAILKSTRIRTLGICNVFWVMVQDIADYLKVSFDQVKLDYFGLNHLSWATRVVVDGVDRTAEVLAHAGDLHEERYRFPRELLEALGALPSPYLRYYYLTPEILGEQAAALKTRAQEVMEIERALLTRYQDPNLSEKPPELMQRGGIHYGRVAVAAMKAVLAKKPSRVVLNLPNRKIFSWLPEQAVIEFPWKVGRSGIAPEKTPRVPDLLKALMIEVKTYEALAIEAALTGNRKAAYQALLVNPLVGSASKAKAVLDEVWVKF